MDNIKIRLREGEKEIEVEGPKELAEKYIDLWRQDLLRQGAPNGTAPFFFDTARNGITLRQRPRRGLASQQLADGLLLLLYAYRKTQNAAEIAAIRLNNDLRESGYADLSKLARAFRRLQSQGLAVRSGRGKGTRYRLTEAGGTAADQMTR